MYFGPDVEISIAEYNLSDDQTDRSLIYQHRIKPALEKLVESIIHTFKFYYTDGQTIQQLQHEVVCFLLEKLPKVSADKGKAYSYLSICAKNYLIVLNRKNYKKLLDHDDIDMVEPAQAQQVTEAVSLDGSLSEFVDQYVDYWDVNVERVFSKRVDTQIALALVELFRKRDRLELFNKKALYIYIRSMTGATTTQVTKMVKVMKDKYERMWADYLEHGILEKSKLY